MTSEINKFYEMSVSERQEWLKNQIKLSETDIELLKNFGALSSNIADHLIENVVGIMEIPLGLAVNFIVNGKEILVPMAVEESSVVAAASHGAKLARSTGGFFATLSNNCMFSQIQLIDIEDVFAAKMKILEHKEHLLALAAKQDILLQQLGGGPVNIEVRVFDKGYLLPMVVVHLIVNTLDAMGANTVNTMAESISEELTNLTGGRALLKIVSNLADKRVARSRCTIQKKLIGGPKVVEDIVKAYQFAVQDPYRAATHNKGIMNGIIPVVLATGNDTRAIEAGAHAYACRFGTYTSLSTWEKDSNGDLVGTLEIPMAIGNIGGITAVHPKAKLNLSIMQIKKASDLAKIIVSVGLAQNLTALKALATDGIQKGHMKLHAKNIAIAVGAKKNQINLIAQQLIAEKNIKMDRAKEILSQMYAE